MRELLALENACQPADPFGLCSFASCEPPPCSPQRALPEGPLGVALQEAIAHRWHGMRSERRNTSQAATGVRTLQAIGGLDLSPGDVTKAHVREAVSRWREGGTEPSTIVARLNCLSVLGVDVKGCRPKVPKALKWWLDKAGEEKIVSALLRSGEQREARLALLIRWTTRTGLRIEESLRLTWADIRCFSVIEDGKRAEVTSVTVPGTKTATAQATLRLSGEATYLLLPLAAHARERHGREPAPSDPVFGLEYWEARNTWRRYRKVFGLADPTIATLKALRRSAARSIHGIRGMPLDMVRQYLRHENVQTTMGYLRLTGGYSEAEMAKWL